MFHDLSTGTEALIAEDLLFLSAMIADATGRLL